MISTALPRPNEVCLSETKYYKENKGIVVIMSKAIDDMRKQENMETARLLLTNDKLSYEEIALVTRLTVQEVKALDTPKTA